MQAKKQQLEHRQSPARTQRDGEGRPPLRRTPQLRGRRMRVQGANIAHGPGIQRLTLGELVYFRYNRSELISSGGISLTR